jgi:hypothetical protein
MASLFRKRIARVSRTAGIAGVSRRRSAPIATRRQRIFEKIAAIPDELSIDSSHVKAHRRRAAQKGGARRSDRPLAGRKGEQDLCFRRWSRQTGRFRPDARKCRRHRHGHSASRRRRSTKARPCGQGLRRRQSAPMAQVKKNQSGHSLHPPRGARHIRSIAPPMSAETSSSARFAS